MNDPVIPTAEMLAEDYIPLFTEAQLKKAILEEREACAVMAHGLAAEGLSGFDIGQAIRARSDEA